MIWVVFIIIVLVVFGQHRLRTVPRGYTLTSQSELEQLLKLFLDYQENESVMVLQNDFDGIRIEVVLYEQTSFIYLMENQLPKDFVGSLNEFEIERSSDNYPMISMRVKNDELILNICELISELYSSSFESITASICGMKKSPFSKIEK